MHSPHNCLHCLTSPLFSPSIYDRHGRSEETPSVASGAAGKRKSPRTLHLTCAPPAGPKTTGDEPLPVDDEALPADAEPLPAGAELLPADDELPSPEKEEPKKKKKKNRRHFTDDDREKFFKKFRALCDDHNITNALILPYLHYYPMHVPNH